MNHQGLIYSQFLTCLTSKFCIFQNSFLGNLEEIFLQNPLEVSLAPGRRAMRYVDLENVHNSLGEQ